MAGGAPALQPGPSSQSKQSLGLSGGHKSEIVMGMSREAKLRPGFGQVYPELRAGWEVAQNVAGRVADKIVSRQGYAALLNRRVLPDEHFEFRGGSSIRPGGRLSRLTDGRR